MGDERVDTMKLSIIMPCYNVASTLSRALDSIIMQQSDFAYEILIVDDASTDNTLEVAEEYIEKHNHIRIIRHEENLGNAHSFYDGLCEAEGEYFTVLDGDDYYTIRCKLQKQVDFLNADVQCEYAAVVHNFIYDFGDGNISLHKRQETSEFSYVDFLTMNMGYYHTSTYMFRNIFKGNVPEYFKDKKFRGDSPRTFFHLKASGGKVKVLDFVGSAYVYSYNGLWSGMSQEKQKEYQLQMINDLKSMATTCFEKQSYDVRFAHVEANWISDENYRIFNSKNIEDSLIYINKYISNLAFEQRDFMLEGSYYSQYVDSLCETLGYINRTIHPECAQTEVNVNRIAIIINRLVPKAGGIFREIMELAEIYSSHEVLLLVTDMKQEEIPISTPGLTNITIKAMPADCKARLYWLSKTMADFSPVKAYYYTSHKDPWLGALMQSGVCKNICLFSFDHGYSCGISNSNLDVIIAKRPFDYMMLSKTFGDMVIYVPTWHMGIRDCDSLKYNPFNGHERLITAAVCARFYKLDDRPQSSYSNNILELLKRTKGQHYHFGPIPPEKLEYIYSSLSWNGLPDSSFVHIPWSDNLAKDMLKNGVDIFIESFPVVSYKITLEVLACGIPVIAQHNLGRMSRMDFIYPRHLLWKQQEDFLDILCNLTLSQLEEHSKLSVEYIKSTHAIDIIKDYLVNEISFPVPQMEGAIDGVIKEVREYGRLFKGHGVFYLLENEDREQQERKELERINKEKSEKLEIERREREREAQEAQEREKQEQEAKNREEQERERELKIREAQEQRRAEEAKIQAAIIAKQNQKKALKAKIIKAIDVNFNKACVLYAFVFFINSTTIFDVFIPVDLFWLGMVFISVAATLVKGIYKPVLFLSVVSLINYYIDISDIVGDSVGFSTALLFAIIAAIVTFIIKRLILYLKSFRRV